MTEKSVENLAENLEDTIKGLQWKPHKKGWDTYYQEEILNEAYLKNKKEIVSSLIEMAAPQNAWDIGANTGEFSRLASQREIETVSFDIDPGCVELNYLQCKKNKEENILPLIMDLTNPTPDFGWAGRERDSMMRRKNADLIIALALVHHLCISNNIPLHKLADFLGNLCKSLIIEFVPKDDEKVKKLLQTRADIFPRYTVEGFESAFKKYFSIAERIPVESSTRILYLLKMKM